jgi:ABC-type lipoprotein export system ATPase subunit
MDVLMEIERLNHSYSMGNSSLSVLKDINLSIKSGEFVAIVGKSGSGKSTLLQLMAGFMKPEKGKINILGTNITGLNENEMAIFRQKNMGFVFQSYNLIPTMTAIENVELPLELAGENRQKRRKRAAEVLETIGLAHREHHYPTELSGGEQQRIAIGRAIVSKPKIILADEPTGNLDSETETQIIKQLIDINKSLKTTLIVVTHDHEIAQSADRIINIKDGRIELK